MGNALLSLSLLGNIIWSFFVSSVAISGNLKDFGMSDGQGQDSISQVTNAAGPSHRNDKGESHNIEEESMQPLIGECGANGDLEEASEMAKLIVTESFKVQLSCSCIFVINHYVADVFELCSGLQHCPNCKR